MTGSRAPIRLARRLVAATVLASAALAFASTANAQSAEDLLRKLRPWIERRFFGEEQPQQADVPEIMGPPTEAQAAAAEGPDQTAGENPASESETAEAPAGNGVLGTEAWPGELVEQGTSAGDEAETAGSTAPSGEGAADAVESAELPEPPPPPEPVDQGPPPLRFALLAGSSASVTMAKVGPIAEEMGAMLDRPVEFLAMFSYAAMVDAQVGQRIDGGFYSASAFALADQRCDCLEPIVAPRASDGTIAYHAIIVARAHSGIESISDLEGKTVAVGSADSIGARRMQLAGLMASGLNPAKTFEGVMEVGSANEAVRMVRDGAADAAFAWSSMAGDVQSGYTRGTLANLVANGELDMDDFVIVWRSPPITHGPFAVLKTLSEAEKDRIGAFLVTLETTRPDAYEALNPFYGGGYAPVDPEDYGGVESMAAQNVDALDLPVAEVPIPEPPQETQPEQD
jgi:phosphonate transport system substrate-binding protein